MKNQIYWLLTCGLGMFCLDAFGQINKLSQLGQQISTFTKVNEEGVVQPCTTSTPKQIVELNTDINFSSSNSDQRSSRTGNGYLGGTFTQQGIGWCDFVVDVGFAAYSSNDDVFTVEANKPSVIGKSLLLPQIGAKGMNSFIIEAGLNNLGGNRGSIFPLKKNEDACRQMEKTNFQNQFGIFTRLQVNSLRWAKAPDTSDVVIGAISILPNVPFFVKNISSDPNKPNNVVLSAFAGATYRRLGGDYARDDFRDERIKILGTDKLSFFGCELGFRLDLDKFYGRMSLTNFNGDFDIAGFSGWQLAVTLGIKAGFKVEGS